MSQDYRTESKKLWRSQKDLPEDDQLKLGCLQRIADATEAMSTYHVKLAESRDTWERIARDRAATICRLEKSNAALRGQITKLKKSKADKAKVE